MSTVGEDWPRVLERLQAGDRLAFMKVNRLISGFLSRMGAYDFRDEWDDLRQEVLLSVVIAVRAARLWDSRAFVGYVRSITRNKFVDRLKRAGRVHERETVPYDETSTRSATTGAGVGPDGDRAADVWLAVAHLSSQHRQVFDGIYRQGKTYEQVARDSGIPLGTVKRRLREGLDELRQRFQGDLENA